MSEVVRVSKMIAGRELSFETGKLAKQASAAVVVTYGETIVLTTVVGADPRAGIDFFPLTVDYREKTAAAGKFPGGFIKRDGRPTNKEILTMRMIDRPCRPAFPKGYMDEVQIQSMVLSYDGENDSDILAMLGAFAALAISDIPFNGPLASVRIGLVDDVFVINPTNQQNHESTLEMVLGGHQEAVNMIEVMAYELSEDVIADAIELGHKSIIEICGMIDELTRRAGQPKQAFTIPDTSAVVELLENRIGQAYRDARQLKVKKERGTAIKELFEPIKEELCPAEGEGQYTPELVRMAIEDFEEKVVREQILSGQRSGGRPNDQLREISCEVGLLPRTHGSALFTRGETQGLVTATLGTIRNEQVVETLQEETRQKFMLHYNFPPFCVGEARRIMGPGRRELGHGALAEKALKPVIPDPDNFPYTIKLVSDILESNGSSSMASVCGGTLAMMDAGIPITQPVAGISIGMVCEGDQTVLLTDILGEEDHYGDMDFKVAGTQFGITGMQLDLKTRGLSYEIIREALSRAKTARLEILKTMLTAIDAPRGELSTYAPKITIITIPVDLIGKVIGPGGKDIKRTQEITGTNIEIEEDGTVTISCVGGDGHLKAKEIIRSMIEPVKIGRTYMGRVVAVKDFGAFIEIAPGKEGLCHISELADRYISSVDEICKNGDEIVCKVIAVDEQGRIKLSRKAAMAEEEAEEAPA